MDEIGVAGDHRAQLNRELISTRGQVIITDVKHTEVLVLDQGVQDAARALVTNLTRGQIKVPQQRPVNVQILAHQPTRIQAEATPGQIYFLQFLRCMQILHQFFQTSWH